MDNMEKNDQFKDTIAETIKDIEKLKCEKKNRKQELNEASSDYTPTQSSMTCRVFHLSPFHQSLEKLLHLQQHHFTS